MTDPDFNIQSLYSAFQKAYESVMSGGESFSGGCAPKDAVAFGHHLKQAVPNCRLNSSTSCDQVEFHNPFSNPCFKKVPVTVLYSRDLCLAPATDLRTKSEMPPHSCSSNQSEIKIMHVWGMAVGKNPDSVDDNSGNMEIHQTVPTQETPGHPGAVAIRANRERTACINEYAQNPSMKTTDDKASRLERRRARKRYWSDPIYAERQRVLQRERRKDPAYAKRERERKRKYRQNPAYRKRERERAKERYKDPIYAESQRIYISTYKRIKKQTSNKKQASKLASIAREQFFSEHHALSPGQVSFNHKGAVHSVGQPGVRNDSSTLIAGYGRLVFYSGFSPLRPPVISEGPGDADHPEPRLCTNGL